jgi:hypothetical protein
MKIHILLFALILVGSDDGRSDKQAQASSRTSVNRTMIRGIWWSPEMPQSAAFQVNDSTFYYPDMFMERKYEIKGDSLFVFFDDGSIVASVIVKLTADSLVLSTDGIEALYTRMEPKRKPE